MKGLKRFKRTVKLLMRVWQRCARLGADAANILDERMPGGFRLGNIVVLKGQHGPAHRGLIQDVLECGARVISDSQPSYFSLLVAIDEFMPGMQDPQVIHHQNVPWLKADRGNVTLVGGVVGLDVLNAALAHSGINAVLSYR